ncbi:hypothetical protein Scep_017467 [Stephania cephalantha]|uniref:CCHC-type domain-containing protein n=1 Tax=Stephania cephalantha TaxID=152367 RepID=A0AAP0IPM7_9MAGN
MEDHNRRAVAAVRSCMSHDSTYGVMDEIWFCREEGVSLDDHLLEFGRILLDLACIGVEVGEEDKAMHLLISVRDSNPLVYDVLPVARESVTVQDVRSALFYDEESKLAKEKKFVGKGGKGGDSRRWYHCGVKGHLIRACLEKNAK